jgi:prepilin-type N-terminal cleavage/methylation domain-containing protein
MLTLPRRSKDELGFTLIEVVVALGILSIIGVIMITSVVRALAITTQVNERTNALTDIERGLERVTRQIRTADPLLIDPDGTCDSNDLTGEQCETDVLQRRLDADAYSDGGLVTYSYYLVDSGTNVELRQDATFTDTTTGVSSVTSTGSFIADIANISLGTPLFRFLSEDPVTGELVPISCAGLDRDLCRSAYATASMVEMTMSKILTEGAPLTVSTAVNIRNTRYQP